MYCALFWEKKCEMDEKCRKSTIWRHLSLNPFLTNNPKWSEKRIMTNDWHFWWPKSPNWWSKCHFDPSKHAIPRIASKNPNPYYLKNSITKANITIIVFEWFLIHENNNDINELLNWSSKKSFHYYIHTSTSTNLK